MPLPPPPPPPSRNPRQLRLHLVHWLECTTMAESSLSPRDPPHCPPVRLEKFNMRLWIAWEKRDLRTETRNCRGNPSGDDFLANVGGKEGVAQGTIRIIGAVRVASQEKAFFSAIAAEEVPIDTTLIPRRRMTISMPRWLLIYSKWNNARRWPMGKVRI